MSIFHKINTVIKVFSEEGFNGIFSILKSKYGLPIPHNQKSKWKEGIKSEIQFWDGYFKTKGYQWDNDYRNRLTHDLPLQQRPAALLSQQMKVYILDVGAGPLTILGKVFEGKDINIVAVDPLAHEYDKILDKYQVQPLVRTQRIAAEDLIQKFPRNTFDLVFARNCIDHVYNPEKAVLQMLHIVKRGSYVLLEHHPNEAKKENYSGLHQWNFSVSASGDFLISSKFNTVNMTKKYEELCSITCELLNEGRDEWLITRIQKR